MRCMLLSPSLSMALLQLASGRLCCPSQDTTYTHHPPRPKLKATFNAEASLGWVQLFHQYLGIPALELGRLGHNGGVFQYEDYVVKVRLLFTCSSTGIL